MAALLGTPADIAEVVVGLTVPHRVLGPVPVEVAAGRGGIADVRERALVVVERPAALDLARQLRAITASRAARARTGVVHVRIDPRDI
jgi:hypothetical protein